MKPPALVEIVTTLATESAALDIARRLVGERLAACGNVGACRSVYRWRGEVQEEGEFLLSLKTLAARADAAERRLREIHPYETPAILRLPVLAADEDYAAWVAECVAPAPGTAGP